MEHTIIHSLRKCICLFCLSALAIASILPLHAQTEPHQNKKDSFLQVISGLPPGKERLDAYRFLLQDMFYNNDVDTVLKYLDIYEKEALAIKSYAHASQAIANRYTLYLNKGKSEDGVARILADLAFFEKYGLWKGYYQVIGIMTNVYCYAGKWDLAAKLANDAYEMAVQQDDLEGEVLTLYAIGAVYYTRQRYEEAADYLQQSLELNNAHFPISHIRLNTYMNLVQALMLKQEPEPERALSLLKDWEKYIKKHIEFSGFEDAGLYSILNTVYANYYTILKDWGKTEHYLNLLKNTPYENDTRNSWVHIYEARKDYPKMLEQASLTVEYAKQMKDTASIISYMKNMAEAFSHLGQADSSIFYFHKADSIKDLIVGAEREAQIDELRTEYEVDKITAEKERNRENFIYALIGCMLLALALCIWIYHSRQILKKNRILYRQIKEHDRLAAEQLRFTSELEQMTKQCDLLSDEQKADAEQPTAITPERNGDRNQRILVEKLNDFLARDRAFTAPDIAPDKIASGIATNKTYLFEAVKVVTGMTLMEYIYSLRLEEAKMMLEVRHELTNEAIAFDCGFGTTRTFYRAFRERYGISPSTYRRMAMEEGTIQ
jgi:AraC-like DNA-binding protein